jgi:hypothetical protein
MEEEYRMQKTKIEPRESLEGREDREEPSIQDSGISRAENGRASTSRADDDASTRGVPPSASQEIDRKEQSPSPPGIPTITISSEDDWDKDNKDQKTATETNGRATPPNSQEEIDIPGSEGVEKPQQAAAGEEDGAERTQEPIHTDGFSFSNKRLCERWLDNLFMVLYEVRNLPPTSSEFT